MTTGTDRAPLPDRGATPPTGVDSAATHDAAPVPREGLLVAALLAGSFVLRATLAGIFPLLESESYYWLWSQDLAAGYVDHPPGIAVLLRAFTALAGLSPFAVRLGPLVVGTLAAFLFHRWCRQLVGPKVALRCLFLFCILPVAFPFGTTATPDAPLQLLWITSLMAFTRAADSGSLGSWLLVGLSTGLCILSKYNGFLLLGVYGGVLLLTPAGRRQLLTPAPWFGLVLLFALIAPNLIWNGDHKAATLATPLRNGIEIELALVNLGKFLALPFALFTPVLAVAFVYRVVAGLRAGRLAGDPVFRLLFCASVLPLGAFAAVSILTEIHIHWPATCFLAAIPLTLAPGPGPGERLLRWGVGTAVFMLAFVVVVPLAALAIPFDEPPHHVRRLKEEFLSQPALQARVRSEVEARDDGHLFLMSRTYNLTSLLTWSASGRVPSLPLMRERFRQFEAWYDDGDLDGWNALVVLKGLERGKDKRVPGQLAEVFERVEHLEPEPVFVGGEALRQWELFWCEGFRGPVEPETP